MPFSTFSCSNYCLAKYVFYADYFPTKSSQKQNERGMNTVTVTIIHSLFPPFPVGLQDLHVTGRGAGFYYRSLRFEL